MKTAMEEIREAIQLAIEVTIAVGRPVAQTRAMAALASLDEVEKQIAEAEERGRKSGYAACTADAAAYVRTLTPGNASPWADRIEANKHVGAAERPKVGSHG